MVENVGGPSQSEFQGGAKVAKVTKPRTGAKGKKTLDYESDDFSSWIDHSTQNATMGKHSFKGLLKKIEEKDKKFMSLG